jgi:hypothetical protein
MTTLRAFHGDPAVKAKYAARMQAHLDADELVQRIGWDQRTGNGCFVGCTLHRYDHALFPAELGLPMWLARLADALHEGMTLADARRFAARFYPAIPVGADVEPVHHRFLAWLMDELLAVVRSTDLDIGLRSRVIAAIVAVRELHLRALSGDRPSPDEWKEARAEAMSVWMAAARAVRVVAAAAAMASAWAAWAVRVEEVVLMAVVTARAASAAEAEQAFYRRMGDALFGFLAEAKPLEDARCATT